MSYCVNCGVKLAKSEKKCPLCKTKVINPNIKKDEYIPAYSNQIETFKKINYKNLSKLIASIFIIIGIITAICDLVFTGSLSWSIYVICSIMYLLSNLIFFLNKNIYLSLTVELITLELFIYVIAYLNNGIHWFIYLVLPFIFILWLYIILCTYLLKKKKSNILKKIALSLFFISFTLLTIEASIDLYKNNIISIKWSFYAMTPITIVSIILYIISYNKRLTEEIKQRIFI